MQLCALLYYKYRRWCMSTRFCSRQAVHGRGRKHVDVRFHHHTQLEADMLALRNDKMLIESPFDIMWKTPKNADFKTLCGLWYEVGTLLALNNISRT